MADLKNKIVVVTGASSGIGRATAIEFGKEGATVALLARSLSGLQGAKKEVEEAGGKAVYFEVDVSDAEQVEKAADRIENDFGPIEIWINNAMNSVFSFFKEVRPEEFKRVTDVTYLGQVYGTMAALKYMLGRNRGSIVLVGSALAYRGIPLQSAYCGAKHGIQGFFDSLRTELIHDKSNVNLSMVQLPALNTTQFEWVLSRLPNKPRPMGTIYQPEVAARAIVYAATHKKREVWTGFPTFQTIIGNKLFPGWLDRILANSAVKGQQTDEPRDSDRKNNLWEPVEGIHSAHGRFDEQAKDSSFMFWLFKNYGWLIPALFVIIAVIIVGLFIL